MITGAAPVAAAPPVTILAKVDGVVHDGGIVFAKPPEGGFTVVGRLPVVHDGGIVFSRLLGVVASRAFGLQAAGERRMRLIMANGRSILTTPDAEGTERVDAEVQPIRSCF